MNSSVAGSMRDARASSEPAAGTIAIVEPCGTGHRANYVRLITQGLLRHGFAVTLAGCNELFDNVLIRTLLRDNDHSRLRCAGHSGGAAPAFVASAVGLIRQEFVYRRLMARIFDDAVEVSGEVDAVIVPFVDYCLHAIGICGTPFRDVPWCGITMKTDLFETERGVRMESGWRGVVRSFALRRISRQRTMKRLFSLHPMTDAYVVGAGIAPRRFEYLPDPAVTLKLTSRAEARSNLGLAENALAILVYGSLGRRKGIPELVTALGTDPPDDIALIMAGRQTEETRRTLAGTTAARLRADGRLVELDRFLDDREEALVFSAADVVWLGYRHHMNMSGVLVLAGRARLPVIACEEGVIGTLSRRHGLGCVLEPTAPGSVQAAIERLRDPVLRERFGANGAVAFAHHTDEHMVQTIIGAFA